ncbi:hypothetical protein IG631_23570 [Alternaria alternata]|nr:hypothetical protein IG631_23570 [Alternaria alternata]
MVEGYLQERQPFKYSSLPLDISQAASPPADTCHFHPGFSATPLVSSSWSLVQQEAAHPCNAAESGLTKGDG